MGFDWIDLTVRPNGHVLPERVQDDLPRITEAMKSFLLKPNMICSNVMDGNNLISRSQAIFMKKEGRSL